MSAKLKQIEAKIDSIEAEIQRVEVKYPLYARQLRTRLVRFRIQAETERQRIAAAADNPDTTLDNFADGGRRTKK